MPEVPPPAQNPDEAKQRIEPKEKTSGSSHESAPSVGRRQAFLDIKRQLTAAELGEQGTQKLILEMLMNAESERDECKSYVTMYHEADKRSATLEVSSKADRRNEALFAVGVGVGCAIIGLAPSFWDLSPKGPLCLGVGIILVTGSVFSRISFK